MKNEYMLLGYVILGSLWVDDLELRKKYEDYEAWLAKRENNALVCYASIEKRIVRKVVHDAETEQLHATQG